HRHPHSFPTRRSSDLNELLAPDQINLGRNGSKDQKLALINSFDPEKRKQIIRGLGPQAFQDLPELRREAIGLTQPQQLVNAELRSEEHTSELQSRGHL